jgi:hypothetical protein
LGDRLLEWRDKKPLGLTSHESKSIESLERISDFEIKVDCEDVPCGFWLHWRRIGSRHRHRN